MRSCQILTSHLERSDFFKENGLPACDAVICADGGLAYRKVLGLSGDVPVYLIGDYDSGALPDDAEREEAQDVIVLPAVKDMTDTEAALDLAVEKGFEDITVLGGLGGRLDHTLGNLALLRKYADDPRVVSLCFEDGQNRVELLSPGTARIPADPRLPYFGLMPWGGAVEGLTVTGAKYPLSDFTLTPDTTLGVSNEVLNGAPFAEVSHREGYLLLIRSSD